MVSPVEGGGGGGGGGKKKGGAGGGGGGGGGVQAQDDATENLASKNLRAVCVRKLIGDFYPVEKHLPSFE